MKINSSEFLTKKIMEIFLQTKISTYAVSVHWVYILRVSTSHSYVLRIFVVLLTMLNCDVCGCLFVVYLILFTKSNNQIIIKYMCCLFGTIKYIFVCPFVFFPPNICGNIICKL